MLTQEQLAHYRTFGFVILKGLFTQEEVEVINAEFERAAERVSTYDKFDGSKRQGFYFRVQDGPFLAGLSEDPRFVGAAEQMFGEDVFAIGPCSVMRFVNPGTKWHPDTVNINQSGVSFLFYLQPVRSDRGALRVIPGSHMNPWHDELRDVRAKQKLGGEHPIKRALGGVPGIPAYACEADPGDAVAFDVRLWHASWGGFVDRRMCRVGFYKYPETDAELEATRWQLIINEPKENAAWDDPDVFPGSWHSNPDTNPKRARWLEQMQEIKGAKTSLRAEMTGMDSTLVPDSDQAIYTKDQIEEAVANVPIYRES